jgi:ABC-type dipeptide/oligopeptide/nickel transport system permease component
MVWRYSAKSRIIVEFIVSLFVIIPAHVILQYAQMTEGKVQSIVNEILALEQTLVAMDQQANPDEYNRQYEILQTKFQDNQPLFEEFFGYMFDLAGISVLCLFFGF